MLQIKNFTKSYGNKKAVDNLDLHIKAGEIYGFIGHNGAGKTTTLKACAGILGFDSGDILIDGVSILSDPISCKKKLAYIPDNPDLYNFYTGMKYLNFIGDIYGISKSEREAAISEYTSVFGMADHLSKPISGYSHGMKQKLAIISALIHSPKLLLLDEPFVGLDPIATHKLKEIMSRVCADGGAIFFSTHVLEVAEKLCDRIAIIKNGKLVTEGATDEVIGSSSLESVFLELEEDNV